MYDKWRTTEITTTGFLKLRERIFDIHCKLALNTFKCLTVHFVSVFKHKMDVAFINQSFLDPRIPVHCSYIYVIVPKVVQNYASRNL